MRKEFDTFGAIDVDDHVYWGAQTERSRRNFPIGAHLMPLEIVHALAQVKEAAALTNHELGALDASRAEAIAAAAREAASGALDAHFPLTVWQTGSGTQTNMNVNEVIANRANEKLGAPRGAQAPIHPNDHVNLGQSSNDSFPTAMHIAVLGALTRRLLPALEYLAATLENKARAWDDIVKIGRTHLQDATPLTLAQEISGYVAEIRHGAARLTACIPDLAALAQGGTAVGTGLNARMGFAENIAARLAVLTGLPLTSAANKFEALASHGAIAALHGALSALAAGLYKIACDIRLAGSGPRAGLGEWILPENEPGSSIMPGKVNPTQVEALTMVCARVMGNQTTIVFAASQGHFELNVMKPVIAHAALESLNLLADSVSSFTLRCVEGMEPDRAHIAAQMESSLMLATALTPALGYDKAAAIAKHAHKHGVSLRAAAKEIAGLDDADFDRLVNPRTMLAPK